MSNHLEQRGAPYSHRIDMSQEDQVEYWTNRYEVTRDALAEAVRQVGSDADKVAVCLGKPA
ncbi:DUF3606 domain-containing protein [Sphingomonas sp. BIUV-7]|uniref:DUF3606 domain-containing protein n=1 Tax=Sphingomonas natans TaxID=3063330 RepID=A0ABT8Y725_9SPHN|nr:DUF3606 domain-containing protein [Sphingomonas sp. BIUV-7]MDO6414127.1 DUF3606 domain-containing protein [Sphingomonas sp. BIUV-7]